MEWHGNSTIFRGYFPGKLDNDGKVVPAEKVKGKPGQSWDEIKSEDSFGAILNEGFVDISFDSNELSQAFWDMADKNNWNCLILENPSNGHIHSYWRKPEGVFENDGRDKKLAVGLIADIHSKSTFIRLRTNGVDRFPPLFEPKEIDEVPEELYPVDTNIDLWGMGEGDGRNQDIFRYILVLQNQLALPKEIVKRILQNTNRFIFSKPLPDNELDIILRDEAFEKPVFFRGKKFLHNVFADYMIAKHHIKRINGQLHIYRGGVYVSGYRYIENLMKSEIPDISGNQRSETIKDIEITILDNVTTDRFANFIAFRNGIYDIAHDTLLPFTPDYIITNRIEWDYNPAAYSEVADKTLSNLACDDTAIRSLLEECIGYCFYRRNIFQKSFILTGVGSNGKSTFLEMLKYLLGESNLSQLELNELGDKFSTATLSGKLANIGDDIADDFLQGKTVALFKKAVTGNGIKGEYKGQDAFFFKPYAKLIFSANEIPRIKSKGFGAIRRRLLIIPFNATFSATLPDGSPNPNFNPFINDEVLQQQPMEYLIQLGIAGLKRVIATNGFTKSEKVQNELENFERDNNPILGWLDSMKDGEEYDIVEEYLTREYLDDIYRCYQVYCTENNFIPVTSAVFSKELRTRFNLVSGNRVVVKGKKRTLLKRAD